MIRNLRPSLLLRLIFATAVAVAWIQSHFAGWEMAWSNAKGKHAGRIVSSEGQLFFQRCSLNPSWGVPVIADKQSKLAMPKDFCVGSNATGKQTIMKIAEFTIPFVQPSPGSFIGLHSQSKMESDQAEGTSWQVNWQEILIAYWVVMLLVLLQPLVQGVQWLLRGRRKTGTNGKTARTDQSSKPEPPITPVVQS